jgi:Type I phosphodiesterase / nucleotide pyrophosphatase
VSQPGHEPPGPELSDGPPGHEPPDGPPGHESPDRPAITRPAYGVASLADVLPGVLAALAGPRDHGDDRLDPLGLAERLDGIRRVAVLLVDGLGYHQMAAAGASGGGVLADITAGRLGDVARLTCGFPSTTPVSLASLGTGVPPGTHGILGFTVRVPGTERVLNHIRWSTDPDPRAWQPVPTVFERAVVAGVAATVLGDASFAGSGLTVAAYRGAPYRSAGRPGRSTGLAARMRRRLAAGTGPALVYGYCPDLDHAGHTHGVGSPEWRAAAVVVERLVARLAAGLPADSALLITADHGQLEVAGPPRFDLDRDPRLTDGVAVVAGDPRVRYLHVVPGAQTDVAATWRGVLDGAARVMTRDEVVAEGWCGAVPDWHLDRIGDLVVAGHASHAVVASGRAPGEATVLGYHGSWTPAEMEIPLVVIRGEARGSSAMS